jgi:hypothetical protein
MARTQHGEQAEGKYHGNRLKFQEGETKLKVKFRIELVEIKGRQQSLQYIPRMKTDREKLHLGNDPCIAIFRIGISTLILNR